MTCCQCEGIQHEFDDRFARRELKRYRKKGLRKTSRMLVDALRERLDGAETMLDIGGGVGGLQYALMEAGIQRVLSVDAAPALVAAAREEAARRGMADRIDHRFDNFVDVADDVPDADIVTLDRVICCYHDMPALVGASAERARSLYGLVYPRSEWWMRAGVRAGNLIMRLRRSPMRGFVHPTEDVDGELRRKGFRVQSRDETLFWQVVVYGR